MAELTPKEQIALHEFSVRYRAAVAKQHPLSDLHLQTFQDAIRSEYEKDKDAHRDISMEPSDPEMNKEPEPEEPEM